MTTDEIATVGSASLHLSSVSHRFGRDGPWVFRGVDLSLSAEGKAVAVVAPSGSGKTTLLGIIGGLIRPTEGEVTWLTESGRPADARSCCAWVLQTTNALGRRTALENVAMVAMAEGDGLGSGRERAAAALAAVGLGEVVDREARKLSGGELQRVAVARALVSKAPFILADEPTGQLDSGTSAAVIEALLGSVRSGGRGLVVVTHDHRISDRCDRVYGLEGHLEETT